MSFNNNIASKELNVSCVGNFADFDYLSIKVASPEKILSWSYGEVKNSETINYRTFKPEKDGLLCARIFGPVKDYECLCGKYKKRKYKGIKCEKCEVEVTESRVRRERMGHINLAYPVVNTLYLKSMPSKIGTVLDISVKEIEKVLYFEKYIVIDPRVSHFNKFQVITYEEYENALNEFGSSGFVAERGGKGINDALVSLDVQKEIEKLNTQMLTTKSELKKKHYYRRLKMLREFVSSGNKPEWMVLTVLPVIPPELRPLVPLDGGRIAISDLNALYANVIIRNIRLKKVIQSNAPDIIIRSACIILQRAVDALFNNTTTGTGSRVLKNSSGQPLHSIAHFLKGKQGRFRQNLLGKRVDYSGRSVIVVGPELKLHECGLPKQMALELFRPFVLAKLRLYGKAATIKAANDMIEMQVPEVWEILESIIIEHPVLLNRAPTLHRLGIQAFEPKLIESKAIRLHPLVCRAFNADFDGDQMAVHIPLSIESQVEARVLMMSSNNILSFTNGDPIIIPRKDITAGLYYMTLEMDDAINKHHTFYSYDDVIIALDNNHITVNTPVKYLFCYNQASDFEEAKVVHSIVTTPGRIILFNLLPQDGLIKFEFVNLAWNIEFLNKIVPHIYMTYGKKVTVIFCDKIMYRGFEYATKSGISIGKNDIIVPESKKTHVATAMNRIREIESQYKAGYITDGERFNKVTDIWSECSGNISKDMMVNIKKNNSNSNINSISIMMNSGARASEIQMRQLAGMKGLIAKPSGEIMEVPVISNFKEGLNVLEYFNAAHGARKGNVDTALKTANAGYLTRRLVDVAQDCIITEDDCGTCNGITYSSKFDGNRLVRHVADIVRGRVLNGDLFDSHGNLIFPNNTMITLEMIDKIKNAKIHTISVRSPVTCQTIFGSCAKCYGMDLSTGHMISIGEAVGVIAAQSIGEPGVQLTLNTFHIGGSATKNIAHSFVNSEFAGTTKFENLDFVLDKNGDKIVVSHSGLVLILNSNNIIGKYHIEYGAKLNIVEKQEITIGTKIAEWDPYNTYIIAEHSGRAVFHDFVRNVSYSETADDNASNKMNKTIINWSDSAKVLQPSITLIDNNGNAVHDKDNDVAIRYILGVNAVILYNEGDDIQIGDKILKIPRSGSTAVKDITGGLPRIEELFEARNVSNAAIIAATDGYVKFTKDSKLKTKFTLHSNDEAQNVVYTVSKDRYVKVYDGSKVKKGDIIVDGTLDPHDILQFQGVDALTVYIVNEVQAVYTLQGIDIDSKHIEIIVRYMLNRVVVLNSGDTNLENGYQYSLSTVRIENQKALSNGMHPAEYQYILYGITKASMQTDSFISAASFQETLKVLTDAAVAGKVDYLRGMKESVILGRLIPAGTGYITRKMRQSTV